MDGIESKEAILVELLNDHIDNLNRGVEQDISEAVASLPPLDTDEIHSLLSIDRLLRMVAISPSSGGEKNKMLEPHPMRIKLRA